MHKFCGRFLVLLTLLSSGVYAADWNIEQLMATLSTQREGRATFVETTYLKMLDRPLESSGELSFAAPDQLQKLTLKPKREALTLKGDELSIERKGRVQRLRVSDYPQVAVFVDSIRATLMGDGAALERAYRVSLSGNAQQWVLVLAPKGEAEKTIRTITINGAASALHAVEIVQADGDRSVMHIEPSVAASAPGEQSH
jgi:outer membrane lipoprotein-sorting protein